MKKNPFQLFAVLIIVTLTDSVKLLQFITQMFFMFTTKYIDTLIGTTILQMPDCQIFRWVKGGTNGL